ncbi:MAG: hypothetical protein ACRDTE_25120 [Pseudonocardiaceae bacterium]
MGEGRWGFEDLGDREYEEISGRRPARPPTEPAETGSGQDADRVVTVQVALTGEVTSVHLATGWKRAVDPRALGTSVLAAANAATAAAMVAQVHRIDGQPPPAPAAADIDRTPLTRQDVNRLLAAVTADLEQFTRQIAEIAGRRVSAESGGRHVSGTAQRGQVLEVSVDPGWASRSRTSEIETELVEVLRELRRRSTPGELAQGPQSSAIAEVTALAADPAGLLRRLRLGRHQQGTEGSNGR